MLPSADRAGVGFPGLLRSGRVVEVNSLMRAVAGGPQDPALVAAWTGVRIDDLIGGALRIPVRVANDADVHALATVTGRGFECVLTLGTGLGFSLVSDGVLVPHLELSGAPFLPGRDFEAVLGADGLAADGQEAWTEHVHEAITALRPFLYFDRLYLGGGNARLLDPEAFPADVVLVENVNGLLGCPLLWWS
jgi:polyphosphate glucokinase